ncbi:MAG TPA: alpha/beta hydrolase [Candidatus Dormibacteraeota bacterium]
MPAVDLRGQSIHFEDTGGDGLPVVLSHGFLMDAEMFEPQVAALRDRYRMITWDQRGHGRTSFDGKAFTYWDCAEDLAALLDHLGIERAVLGGMSAGGFISLRLALLQPERVLGLILIDSQAGLEDPVNVPSYDAMHEVWTTEGPSDQLLEMVAAIINGDYERNADWITKWKAQPAEAMTPVYRCLMDRDDITDRLPEVGVPALVIHGEVDAAIPMERAEALCAGLAGCAGVTRIESGSHASNLTQPERVNQAIGAFLASLSVTALSE